MLYHKLDGTLFELNETASDITDIINEGANSVDDIVDKLIAIYDIPRDEILVRFKNLLMNLKSIKF